MSGDVAELGVSAFEEEIFVIEGLRIVGKERGGEVNLELERCFSPYKNR